ncbi:hypothetical protein KPH14_006576 [Odynerus spinipes]|uniref:Uncharacterized protein n=1 Tax=Odynerus spinipes TaxID=1348599 RepID=A0AAD9RQT3_9HYME|nr:hypothetical protein KPH14_006576 [Odynerus spinipes]
MATAGNASAGGESSGAGSNNVPQWKRDLIQRRRQQNKVLSSNGACVKLCSAVTGTATTTTTSMTVEGVDTTSVVAACRQEQRDALSPRRTPTCEEEKLAVNVTNNNNNEAGSVVAGGGGIASSSGGGGACVGVGGGTGTLSPTPTTSVTPIGGRAPAGGATVHHGGGNSCEVGSVARNMRLEADLSLCSDSEDVVNGGGGGSSGAGGASNRSTDMERKQEHGGDGYESEEGGGGLGTRRMTNNSVFEELRGTTSNSSNGGGGGSNITGSSRMNEADAESDSSEELQYGPGIVNKLKSKYLNLALRETNKSRATVQRFRRAASLEDLLDREDEPVNEKNNGTSVSGRKYAKRNVPGQAGKTGGDRYRNANRGNEMTMKRARSVETLVRYNNTSSSTSSIDDSSLARTHLGARIAPRQDPVNDHIVLVDRTSVKIESRLSEIDRPKPANKPKRIKPVLAETERPPPDLVKTTMRIFEGSAKKLKPKGEVAAKVATFKTINDTFKAQNQKKILPKPPLQPKPFVNGNARPTNNTSSSPKKIVLPQKPTAELIETDEEFHFDGVITDPIVQSVSSVVSKFQQIEKSHSPSPSPEPTFSKLRFSPAPSPEPQNRTKLGALEIGVKSPPLTPLLSPRIASPGVQSPSSPIKDIGVPLLQNVSPIRKVSPVKDAPEMGKFVQTRSRQMMEKEPVIPVSTRQRVPSPERNETVESSIAKDLPTEKAEVEERQEEEVEATEDQEDGPKTISSSALDNIGKAGTTMHFRFNDEPNAKNYLPGAPKQNGRKLEERPTVVTKPNTNETKNHSESFGSLQDQEIASRLLRERLAPEKEEKRKNEDNNGEIIDDNKVVLLESKPPKSASLITSTTTSYPQGNESKTIRCQKSESSPPQKQIGIIRPLVSTKTQHPQQNLSNRELEKNLINRVKSIEQPTKVVVSLKSADEIQPTKKSTTGGGGVGGGGGGGLWDAKPWNQQNNTMVFNFSNRKDVPDYIENDGLIIKRKREKPKVGDGGIIVLDATLDASTTDDSEWELSGGPPSPCDVSFLNDNILINGRSNLSRTPRNHKHRIQFDDTATRTFEYPSEASMLEGEGNSSSVDGETSASAEQSTQITNKTSTAGSTSIPSLLGGGGLASYTPSKVDLASEGFELGVTRATPTSTGSSNTNGNDQQQQQQQQGQNASEVDYLKPAQDGGAWGSETTGDLLY